MKLYIVAALSAALIAPASGATDANSGIYILEGCQALADNNIESHPNAAIPLGMCAGAITSMTEVLNTRGATCPPESVSKQQAAMVVSKYMKEHPNELDQDYPTIIAKALIEAWPCKTAK